MLSIVFINIDLEVTVYDIEHIVTSFSPKPIMYLNKVTTVFQVGETKVSCAIVQVVPPLFFYK